MGVYLVTGCAGFVGSKVAELLLQDRHLVLGVDHLGNEYDVRLKYWHLKRLYKKRGFEFHRLDICNRKEIVDLFSRSSLVKINKKPVFDAVVNMATRTGFNQSIEDPLAFIDTNISGTLHLLELSRKYGIPKFVLASSAWLNEKFLKLQDAYSNCFDYRYFLTPYETSKQAAESLCYTYHFVHNLDVTVFRYFTVYGPGNRPDMMPFRLVQRIIEGLPIKIYGNVSQSINYTYIDDIARGTIFGLRPLNYEIIDLGSDRPLLLIDAIRIVEDLIGKKAILVYENEYSDISSPNMSDFERAKLILGWCPLVQIEVGFQKLVEWYVRNRRWAHEVNSE